MFGGETQKFLVDRVRLRCLLKVPMTVAGGCWRPTPSPGEGAGLGSLRMATGHRVCTVLTLEGCHRKDSR